MYLVYKDKNILFKILPCMLIAMFLIMCFSGSCFAGEIVVEDVTYSTNDFIDSFANKIIIKDTSRGGVFYCSLLTNSRVIYDSSSKTLLTADGSAFYDFVNIGSNSSLSKVLLNCSDGDFRHEISSFKTEFYTYDLSKFVYSCPLYDFDGNVVFQVAPQEEEPILTQTITSVDFSEVLAEVLAILPILLVVVIGLLALRKAIKLLLQTLHQA